MSAPMWSHPTATTYSPFLGFAAAAAATVRQMNRQLRGMNLWLVTSVVDDRQVVVASAGEWSDRARPGTEFSWQASLCVRMVSTNAPALALDTASDELYRSAIIGPLAKVRAYLGVPLVLQDGEVFGTLCAFAGEPQPVTWERAMPSVVYMGRMLSTVRSGEQAAHDRSVDAARAYALADRDPLTALRNRRGFEDGVRAEQGRILRSGARSSILVLSLREPQEAGHPGDDALRRCAEVLEALCVPGDVVARTDGTEFAILAADTDLVGVRARQALLRHDLRSAGLTVRVGSATRRPGEDLTSTWARAEDALRADERRRGTGAAGSRVRTHE